MLSKWHFLTAALFAAVSLYGADVLQEKARQGDPGSQLKLAGEYFYGTNRQQNLSLARYWFRRSAMSEHPAGQYNFALCLYHGWGGEKNLPAAFVFFGKAARNGIAPAAVHYAQMLFNGVPEGRLDDQRLPAVAANREKALDILRQAVRQNHPEAMLQLAKYLFMDVVNHGAELRELLSKYTASVADPDPEALVIYAACVRSGIGGFIPDPAAGAKILQRAVDKKHPEATAQLAEMYFYGFGVKLDRQYALKLYSQAIASGSSRAMTDVALLKMAGHIMEHDPVGAFGLLTQAAAANYPPAIRELGKCYALGSGTMQDGKKAISCYRQAVDAGDAPAAYLLGMCLKNGEFTPKDLTAAFHFFQMAARSGHIGGIRETGKALLAGNGVDPHPENGLKLLKKAAQAGDREAISILQNY